MNQVKIELINDLKDIKITYSKRKENCEIFLNFSEKNSNDQNLHEKFRNFIDGIIENYDNLNISLVNEDELIKKKDKQVVENIALSMKTELEKEVNQIRDFMKRTDK